MRGASLRPARVVGALAAAALGAATVLVGATAAHAATTTTLSLDCSAVSSTSQTMYVADPADTFTFSLTGFDRATDRLTNTDLGPLDPAGATFVVGAGQRVRFSDTSAACTKTFTVRVSLADAETVPAGQLLFTSDIAIPADPAEIVVTETQNDTHFLGGLPTCALSTSVDGRHVFGTQQITVLAEGTFTFRGLSSDPAGRYLPLQPYDPIGDPFLAVYRAFDPTQPDVGVVGCNDDLNDLGALHQAEALSDGSVIDGHQPYFTADLTPGVYTLVLMTWEDLGTGDFQAGFGPYSQRAFTPGAKTTRFQMWGPQGALALSAVDPAVVPAAAPVAAVATLPVTGATDVAPAAIAGGILLAAGSALLVLRRMRRRTE